MKNDELFILEKKNFHSLIDFFLNCLLFIISALILIN